MDVTTIPASVSDFVGDWMLVSVKPQSEQRIERELTAKGIQNFLPRLWREKTYARKSGNGTTTKKWAIVAWTGYIFVCGDAKAEYAVRESLWNIFIRPIKDNPAKTIRFLKYYQDDFNVGLPDRPRGIVIGSKVRICDGPMQGIYARGVVESVKGSRATILTLFMGRVQPIDIDIANLELDV
jgi:transcription antitermination factor NusG